LNWKHLVFSIATVVVIAIAIFTYSGYISLDTSIIFTLVTVILAMLSLFVPSLVDYSLKPRVSLEIGNLEFIRKEYHDVEGYLLKGLITNKGKRICLNLDVAFKIEDARHNSPNLLYVRLDTENGQETVNTREEAMRDINYVWINERDRITKGMWKELRQKDSVAFLFPYESVDIGVGSHFWWSEFLLKLENNAEYQVTVEAKGEDGDKNTVMKSKTDKIRPH
jgi:hypothetical protein